MSVQYEIWLTDDAGQRLALLKNYFFFTYLRAVNTLGTCNLGLDFREFSRKFNPWFRPDWRLEVWRRPSYGATLMLEDVFMLRKPNIYTRDDDVQVLQFYGRNGFDLLNRRFVIQRDESEWATKSGLIDDLMKEIVREQMLFGSALDEDGVVDNTRAWPENEFFVDVDMGVGPSTLGTISFSGKQVSVVLKDLKDVSYQLNAEDRNNKRILFGVIPFYTSGQNPTSGAPIGWKFTTRADLWGVDRVSGKEFSLENENIENPRYSENHLEEYNNTYVFGNGRAETQIIVSVEDTDRVTSSRWNRIENVISESQYIRTASLQFAGRADLENGKPKIEIPLVFLNTQKSSTTPQSLYRVDWDLGDRVSVSYGGLQFQTEIKYINVGINEDGKENITGRNEYIA